MCEHVEEHDSHNETSIIKEEDGPLLITFPVVKAENQVSCMCVVSSVS